MEVMAFLLSHGTNTEHATKSRNTPLHIGTPLSLKISDMLI